MHTLLFSSCSLFPRDVLCWARSQDSSVAPGEDGLEAADQLFTAMLKPSGCSGSSHNTGSLQSGTQCLWVLWARWASGQHPPRAKRGRLASTGITLLLAASEVDVFLCLRSTATHISRDLKIPTHRSAMWQKRVFKNSKLHLHFLHLPRVTRFFLLGKLHLKNSFCSCKKHYTDFWAVDDYNSADGLPAFFGKWTDCTLVSNTITLSLLLIEHRMHSCIKN